MCGILGISGVKTEDEVFLKALDTLSHRGPDGYGIWKNNDECIFIGHRRLSIIDLSDGGKQPMEYGNYVITFNGELYNYIEIRNELIKKGHKFNTESDTEVLIKSFIEWKQDCLHKFNGMWAFVIYNKETKEFFLSRDRFGKKPLFYHISGDTFIFASEMKAIAPFLKSIKPNSEFPKMVKEHFTYEATDKCLIEDISRFPAGHYGHYNLNRKKLLIKSYWNTLDNLITVPVKYKEQVEQYRELFIDACKIRMRSDVPIGTALSGGLDSSGVICTMAHIGKTISEEKISKNWQHAYVATFPDSFLNEKPYAEKVVNHIGIGANYLEIDPVEGINKLSDYLYYFEEIDATSPIPMSKIYEAIRKDGTRVSIDGHGVDESFSGYGHSVFEAFLDTINPNEIKNIISTYRELHPAEFTIKDSKSDFHIYKNYLLKRKQTVARNLLKNIPFIGNIIPDGPIEKLGNFNYNLYLLFHQSVLPTLLRNYDRYSMMNGVEIRMPFMDHRLISYAFSLPWQSKLKNGYTKFIIRDALKDFMPDEITWRKSKIGFQTPILQYIQGPWKDYFSDTINSTGFKTSVLVDHNLAKNKLNKILTSENVTYQDAKDLWMQTIPYFWEQSFLKRIG